MHNAIVDTNQFSTIKYHSTVIITNLLEIAWLKNKYIPKHVANNFLNL